jgi:hypothetical protein
MQIRLLKGVEESTIGQVAIPDFNIVDTAENIVSVVKLVDIDAILSYLYYELVVRVHDSGFEFVAPYEL